LTLCIACMYRPMKGKRESVRCSWTRRAFICTSARDCTGRAILRGIYALTLNRRKTMADNVLESGPPSAKRPKLSSPALSVSASDGNGNVNNNVSRAAVCGGESAAVRLLVWKKTLDVCSQELSFVVSYLFVCIVPWYLNNLAGIASRLIYSVFSFEVDEVRYNTVCGHLSVQNSMPCFSGCYTNFSLCSSLWDVESRGWCQRFMGWCILSLSGKGGILDMNML